MNRCKPEQVGTKEHGELLKRVQVLEDGRIPAKRARNLKTEGQREKDYKKRIQETGTRSKREDSWHRKVCGTSPERRCCRTEVHCPRKKETW